MAWKRSARRPWACLLISACVLGGAARPAAADWTPSRRFSQRGHRETFCGFFSGPACTHSLYFDGNAEYQRNIDDYPGEKDFFRVGAELGYLVRVGRSYSQVGLAVEGGGLWNDRFQGWFVVPKLRHRWWPLHSTIAIESGAGFVFGGQQVVSTEPWARRLGGQVEVGVSFDGGFTILTGGQLLRAPDGTMSGAFFVGARLTMLLSPWIILAALGRSGRD